MTQRVGIRSVVPTEQASTIPEVVAGMFKQLRNSGIELDWEPFRIEMKEGPFGKEFNMELEGK